MQVLRTTNLTKQYGKVQAVSAVDLTVDQGEVVGLIGLNGAGKTTLLRLITGLSRPDSGEIELFGHSSGKELNNARTRTGCVIDSPSFFPNLTAFQNLEFYRRQRGIPDKQVVTNSLEQVGLEDANKTKYKRLSLGMKQRLGLALAILNNPDLLILDEPMNGLDPKGASQIRDLLRQLSQRGTAILISSHHLAELSQVATRYVIIDHGRIVKSITDEQLQEDCRQALSITVDDPAKAATILETALDIHDYKHVDANELRVYEPVDDPAEVSNTLTQGGVKVSYVTAIDDTLEDYFTRTLEGATP